MGYGQVNVGGTQVSKANIVSLFNNDSPSKRQSQVHSEALRTTATTTVYYALFTYSEKGGSFDDTIKIQGSNDNISWTDIKTINNTGRNCRTYQSTTNGYVYYRVYSSCGGDNYGPRDCNCGIISTSELHLTQGNQ